MKCYLEFLYEFLEVLDDLFKYSGLVFDAVKWDDIIVEALSRG